MVRLVSNRVLVARPDFGLQKVRPQDAHFVRIAAVKMGLLLHHTGLASTQQPVVVVSWPATSTALNLALLSLAFAPAVPALWYWLLTVEATVVRLAVAAEI